MIFNKNSVAIYIALLLSLPSLVESALRARELTVCDTLQACYLVNIQTRDETKLDGSDSFALDPSNPDGYSIRCDVNDDDGAELHFFKFFYDGKVQDEFGLPRYMAGDSDEGAYINKVDYLSTCGKKTVKIEGHVWSNMCFDKVFTIDVTNADGKPCNGDVPVNPPVKAPVKSPTNSPIAPVKPPVKPPTSVCPYPEEWINGCCKNTCRNDFICPANSYRIAHRLCYDNFDDCCCSSGYIKSGDKCVPIKAPAPAPVKPPVNPPTPVCPYPKQLINGCCKDVPVCPSPKQWINGCCQEVCNSNYACPANSYKSSSCAYNFDHCTCNYGFYKSNDGKCIKSWWCAW